MGVFYGMGRISMSVPCEVPQDSSVKYAELAVKRLPRANVLNITCNKAIPLLSNISPNEPPLSLLKFKTISDIKNALIMQKCLNLNLIWHTGWLLKNDNSGALRLPCDELYENGDGLRPHWSGFMQTVCVGNHSAPADFRLLPIIDLNPGDKSCILSTLKFIGQQATKLNIETACVTIDQPLWLKAIEVIKAEKLTNIVCKLGGFHMLMSYLGSIGSVMSGLGLSDVLECCYGPNTVQHMLTGKAVSRAIRGHFLIKSALNTLLIRSVLSCVDDDNAALASSPVDPGRR